MLCLLYERLIHGMLNCIKMLFISVFECYMFCYTYFYNVIYRDFMTISYRIKCGTTASLTHTFLFWPHFCKQAIYRWC